MSIIICINLSRIIKNKMKMKKTEQPLLDKSTEEKIKVTAEKLFMEQGFSATRTRDIAEAAGINLALLNYYYRSKKNLFDVIIMEKLDAFYDIMLEILKNNELSYVERLKILTNKYTDLMIGQPKLVLFLISEVIQNPDFFTDKLNVRSKAKNSNLVTKYNEEDIQIFLDCIGMTLYPFIIRGALEKVFELNEEESEQLLNNRRERISAYLTQSYKNKTD